MAETPNEITFICCDSCAVYLINGDASGLHSEQGDSGLLVASSFEDAWVGNGYILTAGGGSIYTESAFCSCCMSALATTTVTAFRAEEEGGKTEAT